MLHGLFNSLPGVSCQRANGALYLFPRFEFPSGVHEAAAAAGKPVDTFYALELLNATGVVHLHSHSHLIICVTTHISSFSFFASIHTVVHGAGKWIRTGQGDSSRQDHLFAARRGIFRVLRADSHVSPRFHEKIFPIKIVHATRCGI